jgi:hypothetical protein
LGVATTISPSPGRDHVSVHERYPIPTHTPCTHVCWEVHVGEQIMANEKILSL